MINSSPRKQVLCAWLRDNYYDTYNSPLKLQKFLLFYELFSKVDGDKYELSYLRGWKRGPVFSDVWGDYSKERELYDITISYTITATDFKADRVRAKKAAFLCNIMTENELSELTHLLDIWRKQKERIDHGEYNVPLNEKDFSENDKNYIEYLKNMYPEKYIDETSIMRIDDTYFLISKKDVPFINEEHFDVLSDMAYSKELENPVYLGYDKETGRIIVD